ncbi:MAG: DUF445 family protein [Firmicutes bacterium]|nr:DUF445 family protein [Bacillota bacterium]
MGFIEFISGPIIGAAIGYFTNYIAVKMLFHPYKPIYIGKLKLPFTPGIMPKRKPALAKAVGNAVGKNLFTSDDLKKILTSSDITDKVTDIMIKKMNKSDLEHSESDNYKSADVLLGNIMNIEELNQMKDDISEFLSDQLMDAIRKVDIGAVIKDQSANIFDNMQDSLGMLSMVLKSGMIEPVLSEISEKLNCFITEHGKEKAKPAIREQIEELSGCPLQEIYSNFNKNILKKILIAAYSSIASDFINNISGNIDIVTIVEKKVADMDVKDLENLCMSVMKKELDSVVNLGAVIGCAIGILNIFI